MKKLSLATLGISSLLMTANCAPSDKIVQPNIILILADDMGFSDLGCYGGEIKTPNLDRLAEQGLRFTQFYNAGKCEPTRASILSGLYHQEARLGLRRGATMGQVLRRAGYTTLTCGKWHVDGTPEERGFDHAFGHLTGATQYFNGDNTFHLDGQPFKIPEEKFYTTDANTDYAIRFIEQARKESPDKPFFLYLAYNAPHSPLQAWPEDIARYEGVYEKGWDQLRQERYNRQLALGLIKKEWELSPRPGNIPAWNSLNAEQKQLEARKMQVYAAMVDRLDQNVGRLLEKMHEWKIEDNTLVLFLSDNGGSPYHSPNAEKEQVQKGLLPGGRDARWEYGLPWANVSNTPFRFYKRNQHEGGNATPLIARWPAVIKNCGGLTDQVGHIIDLMATFADVAGLDYQKEFAGQPTPPFGTKTYDGKRNLQQSGGDPIPELPGKSLLPILAGQSWEEHQALFFQLVNHRAVRAGNWKLVSHDGQPWELYDIAADRTELRDLTAQQSDKAQSLAQQWDEWWQTVGNGEKYRDNPSNPGNYNREADKAAKRDVGKRKPKE